MKLRTCSLAKPLFILIAQSKSPLKFQDWPKLRQCKAVLSEHQWTESARMIYGFFVYCLICQIVFNLCQSDSPLFNDCRISQIYGATILAPNASHSIKMLQFRSSSAKLKMSEQLRLESFLLGCALRTQSEASQTLMLRVLNQNFTNQCKLGLTSRLPAFTWLFD